MKKQILVFALALFVIASNLMAQTKEVTGGHEFKVTLPEYMKETIGLNSAASIQFKNIVKDCYGFIIDDTKRSLELAEMSFANVEEFYQDFIKDFAKEEEERIVTTPNTFKKGNYNYIESDLTYYDKASDVRIYYFIGIVETNQSFYKVLCWSAKENKDKFKEDFRKIFLSVKDK